MEESLSFIGSMIQRTSEGNSAVHLHHC
jgi:hypothetical protein